MTGQFDVHGQFMDIPQHPEGDQPEARPPLRIALVAVACWVFLTVVFALPYLLSDGGRSFSAELRRQAPWAAVNVLIIFGLMLWQNRRKRSSASEDSE